MAPVLENNVEQIKSTLKELKEKRRALASQLTEVCPPRVPDEPAGDGLISKLLGVLFKKPPSAPAGSNRDALIAKAKALDEAITRLGKTLLDVKAKAEAERVARLMPGYRQAVVELEAALEAAVQANKKVMNIQLELCFTQQSMSWEQLNFPGGPSRLPIMAWWQRVEVFLNSL